MILTASPNLLESMNEERQKHQEPGLWFKLLLLFGVCLFFISCASTPQKRFAYDSTANPTDEIRNLQTEMSRAETEQIAVFAPKSYEQANKYMDKARSLQEKGASNEKVLAALGNARGFFEQAKTVASNSESALSGVVDARENALIAGAPLHRRKELNEADRKLMDVTKEFENKNPNIAMKTKTDLQNRYLNLELNSIKAMRLGDAQSTIEAARRMGAEKYAPRSLAKAQSALRAAEVNINTDRHNDALISASAGEALYEAQKLLKVTDLSRKTGRAGNEGLAVGIVERDEKINALNEQRTLEQAEILAEQARIQRQQEMLKRQRSQSQSQTQEQLAEAQQSAESARQALEARRRVDQAYQEAQNAFSPQEADVYRQGGNLIIRLKAVGFSSGRAEIPSSSFQTLNKVRDVIQEMNAKQVTVEGHTDSTGGQQANQNLSEKRAESVAQFLRQDIGRRSGGSSGSNLEIDSRGYGYNQPIATNKTKKGRALNRRVDIVISPSLGNE